MEKLNKSYDGMKTQVAMAHAVTSEVRGEASSLMAQRRQMETKQKLLKAFQEHFVLSDDEVASLNLATEPVDERFFATLAKAKKISRDCEILLGFEHQTLGLEVMDQTSKNLNLAFQKLYKWIQREFKTLNLENPQIGSSIRRALRVLAERPTLFNNCLEFFAEAREHVLSDAFYAALTGSSASGTQDHSVKPIELAAHDPLRYAGDMLAWTHSATVSEKEALEILFVSDGDEIAKGIQEGRENEVWRLIEGEDEVTPPFDPAKALNNLVDKNMSGVARTLRQRVEQVIQTNEETILAYKLSNLLNFYRVTFTRLLGDGSLLVESLGSLESDALRQFRSLVRDHIAALQGEFQHTPADLGLPEFLIDALEQATAIMKTYETSLASAVNREADFRAVLSEAFDPFVSGCENMTKNVAAPADSIFLINCLTAAKACLLPFDFTRSRAGEVQGRIDTECRKLSDSQYLFLRLSSGLDGLIHALDPLDSQDIDVEKVKSGNMMQPAALTSAAQELDDFLPSALMDALENLRYLQNSKLARDITEDAAERFCVDFEHVEEILTAVDEIAGRQGKGEEEAQGKDSCQSLRALFPRTTGEIRVLLS